MGQHDAHHKVQAFCSWEFTASPGGQLAYQPYGDHENACCDNAGKLICWPLESVVTGGSNIYALKAPAGHDYVSWHELASWHTPLILAFGEINNKILSEEDEDVKWINRTATHDLGLAVFGLKNFKIRQRSILDAHGPIIWPLA